MINRDWLFDSTTRTNWYVRHHISRIRPIRSSFGVVSACKSLKQSFAFETACNYNEKLQSSYKHRCYDHTPVFSSLSFLLCLFCWEKSAPHLCTHRFEFVLHKSVIPQVDNTSRAIISQNTKLKRGLQQQQVPALKSTIQDLSSVYQV